MKNALSLAQNGQQGVMAFTTGALRVVAFCRILLAATALKLHFVLQLFSATVFRTRQFLF
jgi:hypothetical protein